ncbi:MAG TPA: hypothetical protein VHP33_27805 [Polyangiaceae bacterium]|nr:hypothetical protein [Polyangiaceae bacterium]
MTRLRVWIACALTGALLTQACNKKTEAPDDVGVGGEMAGASEAGAGGMGADPDVGGAAGFGSESGGAAGALGGALGGGEAGGAAEGGSGGAAGDTGAGGGSAGGGSLSLYGSIVKYSGHCCAYPPTDTNRLGAARTADVGEDVELPDISGTAAGLHTIAANIDVLPSSVEITYNEALSSAAGTFNGYVLAFTGAPTITAASFGPNSTVNLSTASVTIEGAALLINVPSVSVKVGSRISVLLTLAE